MAVQFFRASYLFNQNVKSKTNKEPSKRLQFSHFSYKILIPKIVQDVEVCIYILKAVRYKLIFLPNTTHFTLICPIVLKR